MDQSVQQYERDVEQTRARLRYHLATLRAPETVSGFKEAVKQDAVDAKDRAAAQVKDAASDALYQMLDTVKGKAAANPVAVLLIGAGVAWKFLRNPPVATALVGAGLLSFMRAEPFKGEDDTAYMNHATERLKQQVDRVTDRAEQTLRPLAQAASEKATSAAHDLKEAALRSTNSIRDGAAGIAHAVSERVETTMDAARRNLHDGRDYLAQTVSSTSEAVAELTRSAQTSIQPEPEFAEFGTFQSASDREYFQVTAQREEAGSMRDQVLLGVAGLAVAAALGFAYRRNNSDA